MKNKHVLKNVPPNRVLFQRPDFIDDDLMDMIKDDKMECMNEHGTTEGNEAHPFKDDTFDSQ